MFSKNIEKKQVKTVQPQPLPTQKVKDLSGNLKASSSHQQNFFLSLGGGDVPYNTTDPTILWSYNIPTLVPSQKRRLIQITNLTALLINYQSAQFPLTLGLQIDSLVGLSYLKWVQPVGQGVPKWQTLPTSVGVWTLARNLNAHQTSSLTSYNVAYQIGQEQVWDVGMMNNITLRLVDDKLNRLSGPFNNPVQLHLKIIHLGQ